MALNVGCSIAIRPNDSTSQCGSPTVGVCCSADPGPIAALSTEARRPTLWRLDFDTGAVRALAIALDGPRDAAVTPDGRRLALTAGYPTREPWVSRISSRRRQTEHQDGDDHVDAETLVRRSCVVLPHRNRTGVVGANGAAFCDRRPSL